MERRTFITASTAAALTTPGAFAAGGGAAAEPSPGRPLLFELRRYRLHTGTMANRFGGLRQGRAAAGRSGAPASARSAPST